MKTPGKDLEGEGSCSNQILVKNNNNKKNPGPQKVTQKEGKPMTR